MAKGKKIQNVRNLRAATKAATRANKHTAKPPPSTFTKAVERTMARWSLPDLQFAVDEDNLTIIRWPEAMQQAYQLASTLLASKRFQFHFKQLFVALHPSSAAACADDKARAFLNQRFTIRLVTDVEDLASLSCAHPAADATAILLHPMLLLNMIRGERSDPQLTSTFALFLAQKLMHEVSHLLHDHLAGGPIERGKRFRDMKMARVSQDDEETVTEMVPEYVMYHDFGTMLERAMGGIFESKSPLDDLFMGISAIGSFPSAASTFGNLVNVEETITSILQRREVPPVLDEQFEVDAVPTFRGRFPLSEEELEGLEWEEKQPLTGFRA